MAYREDKHLEFLQVCSNDELEVLAELLLKDWNNDLQYTTPYKNYFERKKRGEKIDHKKYWKYIAEEYQLYGGNTIINYLFRWGEGVLYKEILEDVVTTLKIKTNKNSVDKMEKDLLKKTIENIATKSIEEMPYEERKKLVKKLDLKTTNFSKQAVTAALQTIIKQGGFTSYKMAVIIANGMSKAIVNRGLSFATNAALTKYMAVFAGPIGWALTGGWTLFSIAGEAHRITIPTTVYIAALRQSKLQTNMFDTVLCPNCRKEFSIENSICPYCKEKAI
jgi:uncharacterized protein YaaW (UPF0174 family)